MDFQILDADYTYDPGGAPVVRLYGRSREGESVCCFVSGFEPYFYVRARRDVVGEIERLERVKRVELVERFEPIGYFKSPVEMLRVVVFDPKDVPAIREEIGRFGSVYETDILFRNRFLIDHGLGGMRWVRALDTGDTALGGNVDAGVRFAAGRVEPLDDPLEKAQAGSGVLGNAPLRYLAFDIECLPRDGGMPVPESSPVILISLAFDPPFRGKRSLVLAARGGFELPDVEALESEGGMLERFFEIVREFDPDMLVGYNIDGFDLPYIKDRLDALKKTGVNIRGVLGRDGNPFYYRRFGSQTRVEVRGRVVVDVLPLLRRDFSLKQYTLSNTARLLLGMEKLDMNPRQMERAWLEGVGLEELVDYSRRDAVLALEMLQRLKLLDKYIALARVSGVLLQDVLYGGQSSMVENLLLSEFRKHKRVVPPKPTARGEWKEEEELKGGAVLEPKRGLLENVVILDYKSLYPTIMMAHNLCYTTVVVRDEPGEVITAPSGGRFASPQVVRGIVPAILEGLLKRRMEAREQMKKAALPEEKRVLDATQLALKILLNSFYGYSGYQRARLYSLTLASAVTSFGRENILRTRDLINSIGEIDLDGKSLELEVVYGDTDSVFVELKGKGEIDFETASRVGREIARMVSRQLPPPMELKFEGIGRRIIFIAKKRYAMWALEKTPQGDWKDEIKVKGMETVRRDWCQLTQQTVDRVLELVLKKGDVDGAVNHVQGVIKHLRSLDIQKNPDALEELILTRQYTKKAESYKSKQPHVTVIEKIAKRTGTPPPIGERIPFVITAGPGLLVERAEDPEYVRENNIPIDVDYYINKQILPPVERILQGFGVKRETLQNRLLASSKNNNRKQKTQKSLFEFT